MYICTLTDQLFNVRMHGDVCLLLSPCQQLTPSRIILSTTREQLHLSWRLLLTKHNVNLTYNNSLDVYHFCFHNVTESFLFLEYCDVNRVQPCEGSSTFCCNNWVEFVARTCVNVVGGRGKLYPTELREFTICSCTQNY